MVPEKRNIDTKQTAEILKYTYTYMISKVYERRSRVEIHPLDVYPRDEHKTIIAAKIMIH